jgi:hypothetical protein
MLQNLKNTLLIILISLFPTWLHAQYKFGIQGGMGSSNYHGKDFPNNNQPKFGPTGGIFYEREINLTISIAGEINYDKKGTNYNYDLGIATNLSFKSQLEYISVPILVKAYIDYNAYFYCYAGISGSYLTKSSNKVTARDYGYIIDSEPFFNLKIRNYDASILLGFGVNFKEIILDIRYHHGIVDIYQGNNVPDIKNQFISATLGFTIYKKQVQHCLNPLRRIK